MNEYERAAAIAGEQFRAIIGQHRAAYDAQRRATEAWRARAERAEAELAANRSADD